MTHRIEVERVTAWSAVIAVHVLLYLGLTQVVMPMAPSNDGGDVAESTTQVIFLPRIADPVRALPAPAQSRPVVPSVAQASVQELDAVTVIRGELAEESTRAPVAAAAPPQSRSAGQSDQWSTTKLSTLPSDFTFKRNPLEDRPSLLGELKKSTFRMKRQVTPENVIKGVAQFVGLWPPGYTIDPCPQIELNISTLVTDTSATARKHLSIELQRAQDYCR